MHMIQMTPFMTLAVTLILYGFFKHSLFFLSNSLWRWYIQTLLWFRQYVCVCVRHCLRARTRYIAYFFVKLTIHVYHDEKMHPSDFYVRGQRSRSQWKNIDITLRLWSWYKSKVIKPSAGVAHEQPYWLSGSKDKVIMGRYRNDLWMH